MLKSWSIQNFKAIVDSGELKFAPVTVLAGRNSSGKSSLLQSILMISQTLSNRVLDRPLLPNGPIVQLGTFEDVLSSIVKYRTLSVDFELDFTPELLDDPILDDDNDYIVNVEHIGSRASSIKVTISFSNDTFHSPANITIKNMSLAIAPEITWSISSNEHSQFNCIVTKATEDFLTKFLQDVSSSYLGLVPYNKESSNYFAEIKTKAEKTQGPYLTKLSHFLPTTLIQKIDLEDEYEEQLKACIFYLFMLDKRNFPRPALAKVYRFEPPKDIFLDTPESLGKQLQELAAEEGLTINLSSNDTFDDLLEDVLSSWFNLIKKELGEDKVKGIIERLQEWIAQELSRRNADKERESKGLEVVTNDLDVLNLNNAVEQTIQFFASKIRYLGPLRADPQASQKFAPSSEIDDIGFKGEYASAVYDANQNASIEWFNPFSSQVEQGTLKVALDSWARYLGVAHQIKIETAGQSGFSWQVVHKEGHKSLPLSAVGVGVSQVLPILVMGLLSPKNSLLIIEQPELHLHPSVQARLGDFFVGLSKCNKQCLIETHSENLVSQLRLHVVQAGGLENSNCMIYFVDQDERGAAKFQPVEISAQGNILNWPDGFFDETMLQEDRITAASIRKRAQAGKNTAKHE